MTAHPIRLQSFVSGRWQDGTGAGRAFVNPTTGAVLGHVDDEGIDGAAALAFARDEGTPALQALSFAGRGALLKSIAEVLGANRARYGEIARLNSGNTSGDAAIDIDGAIATLKVYARLGQSLGDTHHLMEPGSDQLAKEPVFFSRHVWTARPGAAVQVNAFNFPSWGLWEKVATALLAGVASVAKPASATAWLAQEMVRDVMKADVVPAGALSLVCGNGRGLIDALGPMDSLAFTGSADTGRMLRGHATILDRAPRLTIEADSVNATIVGPDAAPGTVLFDLAVREVIKALSVKAGQLCTNIRRVLVARQHAGAFAEAVTAAAARLTLGDPALEAVRVGPLVNMAQRQAALDGIARLATEASTVFGGGIPDRAEGADPQAGAFVAPTLLMCDRPAEARAVHETEVFGPCLTLMPYDDLDQAAALGRRGGGSLALSLFSADRAVQMAVIAALAPWHGRLLLVDETVGKAHSGHAIVMPHCVHGGPGRAGGGEELGGLRGLRFHMQRSAIQASPELLEALAGNGAEAVL